MNQGNRNSNETSDSTQNQGVTQPFFGFGQRPHPLGTETDLQMSPFDQTGGPLHHQNSLLFNLTAGLPVVGPMFPFGGIGGPNVVSDDLPPARLSVDELKLEKKFEIDESQREYVRKMTDEVVQELVPMFKMRALMEARPIKTIPVSQLLLVQVSLFFFSLFFCSVVVSLSRYFLVLFFLLRNWAMAT